MNLLLRCQSTKLVLELGVEAQQLKKNQGLASELQHNRKTSSRAAARPLKWLQTSKAQVHAAETALHRRRAAVRNNHANASLHDRWRFKSLCAQQAGRQRGRTHPSTATRTAPLSSKPSRSLSAPAVSGWIRMTRPVSALLCNHSSSHRGDRVSVEVHNEMGGLYPYWYRQVTASGSNCVGKSRWLRKMSPPSTHDPSQLQHYEGTKMFRFSFRLRRFITNAAFGIPWCVGTCTRVREGQDRRAGHSCRGQSHWCHWSTEGRGRFWPIITRNSEALEILIPDRKGAVERRIIPDRLSKIPREEGRRSIAAFM